MRKLIGLATASLLIAAPALAGSMTVEFAADGETDVIVVTLVDDGTYSSSDGSTGSYTWDDETQTLCGTSEEGEVCATFEGEASEPAVGDTRAFTNTAGMSGVATITAIEE